MAAKASGAGGVEALAPPEVALPRANKTLANLLCFYIPSSMSAPEKKCCESNMP